VDQILLSFAVAGAAVGSYIIILFKQGDVVFSLQEVSGG
jgi:hypothetical protein